AVLSQLARRLVALVAFEARGDGFERLAQRLLPRALALLRALEVGRKVTSQRRLCRELLGDGRDVLLQLVGQFLPRLVAAGAAIQEMQRLLQPADVFLLRAQLGGDLRQLLLQLVDPPEGALQLDAHPAVGARRRSAAAPRGRVGRRCLAHRGPPCPSMGSTLPISRTTSIEATCVIAVASEPPCARWVVKTSSAVPASTSASNCTIEAMLTPLSPSAPAISASTPAWSDTVTRR